MASGLLANNKRNGYGKLSTHCRTGQALRCAGTPAYTCQQLFRVAYQQWRAPELAFHHARQITRRFDARIGTSAQPTQIIFTKATLRNQPQTLRQLHAIAKFRMTIQRQMIGKKIYVMCQQQFQAMMFGTDDAGIFAAPEVTVMHQDGICLGSYGGFQQGATGGHAGD